MKKLLSIILFLFAAAILSGCGKQPSDKQEEQTIDARCEIMSDSSDKAMEDFVDDDQGVIEF